MKRVGPIVLTILDGWGIAPNSRGNAITQAQTPNINAWQKKYPISILEASGSAVGLNPGQDGNSEAGHMNIGAGRVVAQESVRISTAINDGMFFRNPAFLSAIRHVKRRNSTLHLMGLLGSSQSAHADPDHLLALLMLVQNQHLQNVKLHLFTDGRDSPRFYARDILTRLMPHLGDTRVATIMGRFYAMDRNKSWSRTHMAYQAIIEGHGAYHVDDPIEAISRSYNRGESDEFIKPTILQGYHGLEDGDAIIHFNLRSDRARQLAKPFVQNEFERLNSTTHPFQRKRIIHELMFVAMTDFGPDLGDVLTAFPAVSLTDTLPMVLQDTRQLYIAESEKYAHVTYFFNGGYPDPVGGEERMMIPSPHVKYYDAVPGMSSQKITDYVCQALKANRYDFIVINFANTDMVAHTGNIPAAIQAMQITDTCLGQLATTLEDAGGTLCVTGDHGNLEEMINLETSEIDTEHSANPVPLYILSPASKPYQLRPHGALCDVAPTILNIMERPIPPAMTGHSLLTS